MIPVKKLSKSQLPYVLYNAAIIYGACSNDSPLSELE